MLAEFETRLRVCLARSDVDSCVHLVETTLLPSRHLINTLSGHIHHLATPLLESNLPFIRWTPVLDRLVQEGELFASLYGQLEAFLGDEETVQLREQYVTRVDHTWLVTIGLDQHIEAEGRASDHHYLSFIHDLLEEHLIYESLLLVPLLIHVRDLLESTADVSRETDRIISYITEDLPQRTPYVR